MPRPPTPTPVSTHLARAPKTFLPSLRAIGGPFAALGFAGVALAAGTGCKVKVALPTRAPARMARAEPQRPSARDLLPLFDDGASFSLEDVKSGKTCKSVREGKVTFSFVPWPPEEKERLASLFAAHPLASRIAPHVHAIYLARYPLGFSWGLTCHDAVSNRMVVLVNEALQRLPRTNGTEGMAVYEDRGDPLSGTFLHELAHVLDMGEFLEPLDDMLQGKRTRDPKDFRLILYESSWKDSTTSVFESAPAAPMSLTDAAGAPDAVAPGGRLAWPDAHPFREDAQDVKLDSPFALQLKSSTGASRARVPAMETLRAQAEFVATRTNFLDPYAASNSLEDFAVTVTAVDTGRRMGYWYRLEFGPPYAPFRFVTEELVRASPAHKAKACLVRAALFNDPCRD